MSGLKSLIGKNQTKKVKFLDNDIEIRKLSVKQVLEIQALASEQKEDDEASGLNMLLTVIRMSVPDAEEISEEDFKTFPMDELTKLSNAILTYSGLNAPGK